MEYRRIIEAFATTPFALQPEKLREIAAFFELKAAGGVLSEAEIASRIAGRRQTEAPLVLHQAAGGSSSTGRSAGSVAVIQIFGVVTQRAGMMSEVSGGSSTERVSARIRQAIADRDVSRIILEIDSPGGGVYGVAELADEIHRARSQKPIIAMASSLAASAAFWIASACSEVVVTPSGEVGSIGVYGIHEDWSKADEKRGVKFTLVKAGKFKAEGVDFAPLTDAAAGHMQARVNDYYSMFVRAVAKGRGVSEKEVRDGFGEGRVVGAAEAVRLKMADRVGTLGDTLARLGVKGGALASAVAFDKSPAAAFDADHDRRANRNALRQRVAK